MTDFFLRAKNWHVFLLNLGAPLVFQLYFVYELFGKGNAWTLSGGENVQNYLWYIPLFSLAGILSQLAWTWSVATGLQEKIPKELRLNTSRFNWMMGIAVCVNLWFFTIFLPDVFAPPDQQLVLAPNSNWLWYFIPLMVLGGLGLIYVQYFAAKSIALARKQARVGLGGWLGYYLLQIVFLFGIWWLQPKVQQGAGSERSATGKTYGDGLV